MNEIIPKSPISIRPAVATDLAFIDALQKKHSKQVGWMQTMALSRKIELGEVLIAEGGGRKAEGGQDESISPHSAFHLPPSPIGYLIGQDRYFKREDVGIVYQLNVSPGNQRGLVGASLLKAQFEKSAYGCKLYCCWCAQDIEANRFWEAMGFVALAFRSGSEKKSRVHIFWQRRIRSGDEVTPYWFPSQTNGGSIREDRLVLPIPPGTHWADAKPMILPEEKAPTLALPRSTRGGSKTRKPVPMDKPGQPGPRQFGAPPTSQELARAVVVEKVEKVKEKKPKRKNDPKLVAAARELRDKWLEQVNAPGGERLLTGCGKYDVSRPALSAVEGMIEGDRQRQGFFVESQVKQLAA